MKTEDEKYIEAFRKEFPIEHYYSEDCWYSCPKAEGGCCNDNVPDECNCGAIELNEKKEAFLLKTIKAVRREEKKKIVEEVKFMTQLTNILLTF